MLDPGEAMAVQAAVEVAAPPARAFAVFTSHMGAWWPIASHHIGDADAADIVIEPRVGGRWYELGVDGTACDWGSVAVWEPPHRVVLIWQLSSTFALDRSLRTEVEVRFLPLADGTTRVTVEHRGLEAYGDAAAEMRDRFGSPNGWTGIVARFAAAAVER